MLPKHTFQRREKCYNTSTGKARLSVNSSTGGAG